MLAKVQVFGCWQSGKKFFCTSSTRRLRSPKKRILQTSIVDQLNLTTYMNGFQDRPCSWWTVIVLLTCLQAHIATCAVHCKAVGLCFKLTLLLFTALNKQRADGGHAHYDMVSKSQWKPFWFATQLYSKNDWAGYQLWHTCTQTGPI